MEAETVLEPGKWEQSGDLESPNAKDKIRSQLQDDIAAFLQNGGKVQLIDQDVRADPPKKPSSAYGSNPI